MTMLDLGWIFTLYVFFSLALFFATSFTILGWIIYGLFLLPAYAIILLVWWLVVWENRDRKARLRPWLWVIVLLLQAAAILASPGHCYGWKQGSRCYSNLQVLVGHAPRGGGSAKIPHWTVVEDNFHTLVLAYGASLAVALAGTSMAKE